MRQPSISLIASIATSTLFAAGVAYLFYQHTVLRHDLTEGRRQCTQQIAQLENEHRTALEQLRRSARSQGDPVLASVETVAGEEDLSDAPDAFKKPSLSRYDESLEEIVSRKYRFLFARLDLDPARLEKLRQLLLERERIAIQINDAREYGELAKVTNIEGLEVQLADIDRQIQQLLNADNAERYELLKDSDAEQHHFTQATLGINGLFPLNNKQQEAVLFAKLQYKQEFEEAVRAAGLYEDYPLAAEQRQELHSVVENAANKYKQRYLQHIRPHLDHSNFPFDQYTLIENYTVTEFKEMLDELRERIDSRSAAN